MSTSPYVLGFDGCSADELTRVGGKCVGLGGLIRAGCSVPVGFAVTSDAYKLTLTRTGLERQIRETLRRVEATDLNAIAEISAELRARLEAVEIPGEIEEAIRWSYDCLGAHYGQPDIAVAVRSSATGEDLPDASFAGQHDTFLWIRGLNSVLRNLVRCWSSLFTVRAISYRSQRGLPHDFAAMGVAIQKMVHARAAGVACTVNPVNGDRSKIVLDASWGLGEAIARGEVTPDQYVVDKVVLDIVKRTVSSKHTEYAIDVAAGKTVRRHVPHERQDVPCLSDEEILAVARAAQRLEAHSGHPLYLEWAIEADVPPPENIFMLQSRPETVWSRRSPLRTSADHAAGAEGVLATLLRRLRPSSWNQP